MAKRGDPYSRFIQIMRKQGKYYNAYAMEIAVVTGLHPFSIIYCGNEIDEDIYSLDNTSYIKGEPVLVQRLEREERDIFVLLGRVVRL